MFNTEPPSELLDQLKISNQLSNLVISYSNIGVWNRFAYAENTKCEYVCIFDDDTIPGQGWLESCLSEMDKKKGLYGTVGIKFKSNLEYLDNIRLGWPSHNETVEEVDIVGHSWFFKREWLKYYWSETKPAYGYDFMGEDMHFSYALQVYAGLKTYVPPHPASQREIWGSLYGQKLGTDKDAISMTAKAFKMNTAFRLQSKGWILLKDLHSFKIKIWRFFTTSDPSERGKYGGYKA